jgi:hypothetical protein
MLAHIMLDGSFVKCPAGEPTYAPGQPGAS